MRYFTSWIGSLLSIALFFGMSLGAQADQKSSPTAVYAAEIHTINPRLGKSEQRNYAEALLANAERFEIDPTFMMAIITVESGWNATAQSWCGAFGLGQLMPGTARAIGVNSHNYQKNLQGTAWYLHHLLGAFSDADQEKQTSETIAGYNAGPVAVKTYGGIPPYAETQRYVHKVLNTWAVLRKRIAARIVATSQTDTTFANIEPVSLVTIDSEPINVETINADSLKAVQIIKQTKK